MPIKWDDETLFKLLIEVVRQNPASLKQKVDTKAIVERWPDAEKPGETMIAKQLTLLRKKAGIVASSTPAKTKSSSTSATKAPSSAASTPSKRLATSLASSSIAKKSKFSSPSKRRAKNKLGSDDDSEEASLPSSDEDTNLGETDEETNTTSKDRTVEKPGRPARASAKKQSYVMEEDSVGEDTGARSDTSDGDAEFGVESSKMDKLKDTSDEGDFDDGMSMTTSRSFQSALTHPDGKDEDV